MILKYPDVSYDDDIYIRHNSQNYCFRFFNNMID